MSVAYCVSSINLVRLKMIAGSPNLSKTQPSDFCIFCSLAAAPSPALNWESSKMSVIRKQKKYSRNTKGQERLNLQKPIALLSLFCLTRRPMFVSCRFLSAFKKKEILIFLFVTEVGRGSGIQHMCSTQWLIHHHGVFNSFLYPAITKGIVKREMLVIFTKLKGPNISWRKVVPDPNTHISLAKWFCRNNVSYRYWKPLGKLVGIADCVGYYFESWHKDKRRTNRNISMHEVVGSGYELIQ